MRRGRTAHAPSPAPRGLQGWLAPAIDAPHRFCYCCDVMKPFQHPMRTTAAALAAMQRAQMLRLLRVDEARRLRRART